MPAAGETVPQPPWTASNIAEFLDFWLNNPVLTPGSQAVLERYYASYKRNFGKYIRHWYARQTAELTGLIRSSGSPDVLEVGCGCGTESLWAALLGAQVVGIDIMDHLLAVANERKSWLEAESGRRLNCCFLKKSILSASDLGAFDIVYMEQSFHHLEPRSEVVPKVSELIRAGGWLVVSEANAWNPLLQLNLLRLRGTTTIATHEGHPWGHERVIVPAALVKTFRDHGLAKERLRYYRTLPNFKAGEAFIHIESCIPQWIRPVFTHYNIVFRKIR